MSNYVDIETAQALQSAGWVGETKAIYTYDEPDHKPTWTLEYVADSLHERYYGWLPAPNLHELRYNEDGTERLTKIDFRDYWWSKVRCADGTPMDFEIEYSGWLFAVTGSANELASMWMWKEGRWIEMKRLHG